MNNSFKQLTKDGIMLMDDYRGGDRIKIKNAMNSFLHLWNFKMPIIFLELELNYNHNVQLNE